MDDRDDVSTGGFLLMKTHEKTKLIRPEHLNHVGTLFGGYMMQWSDGDLVAGLNGRVRARVGKK